MKILLAAGNEFQVEMSKDEAMQLIAATAVAVKDGLRTGYSSRCSFAAVVESASLKTQYPGTFSVRVKREGE